MCHLKVTIAPVTAGALGMVKKGTDKHINKIPDSRSLYHHHHYHVVPQARISLTFSRHFSQSFIASGRSSGLHPVSSHSCWMYVRASRPAFVRPYVGVHRSTSLMSSSLLLQQWPACLVRLTWIVFVMGGRWPYSWCLHKAAYIKYKKLHFAKLLISLGECYQCKVKLAT